MEPYEMQPGTDARSSRPVRVDLRHQPPGPRTHDAWKTWVGKESVPEFVSRVDADIAAGKFPHRFAGFLDHARRALAGRPERDLTPGHLAAELLGYALDVLEGRARPEA